MISENGEQVGIIPLQEAQEKADNLGLDLVEVAPDAKPPVCRIQDHKKLMYEQRKRQKDSRKKQKQLEVKEIKMRVRIDPHDFQTKVNHMIGFLKQGHKCKLTIQFFGREMEHKDLGRKIIEQTTEKVSEVGEPEGRVNSMGRMMNLIYAPSKGSKTEKSNQKNEDKQESKSADERQAQQP